MMNIQKENNSSCFFCQEINYLLPITNDINEILFKSIVSNSSNIIYKYFNEILFKIESKDKIFFICENCLNKVMNCHFFGVYIIPKNYFGHLQLLNLLFMELMEIFKILRQKIIEINIKIFKNIKLLFDYINNNSKIFYTQFGNKNFVLLIEQLYSLINLLKDDINSNNFTNNLEINFLNKMKNDIEQILSIINYYKMYNYPYFDFNLNQFSYFNFLIYKNYENYCKNIEKNKNNLNELIFEYNNLKK